LLPLVAAALMSLSASFSASLQNMYGAALRRWDDDGAHKLTKQPSVSSEDTYFLTSLIEKMHYLSNINISMQAYISQL
jgi:hypothetical protein